MNVTIDHLINRKTPVYLPDRHRHSARIFWGLFLSLIFALLASPNSDPRLLFQFFYYLLPICVCGSPASVMAFRWGHGCRSSSFFAVFFSYYADE